jgi:hypothetical protein
MVAHVGGRRQINPLAYWQFDALEQGATAQGHGRIRSIDWTMRCGMELQARRQTSVSVIT